MPTSQIVANDPNQAPGQRHCFGRNTGVITGLNSKAYEGWGKQIRVWPYACYVMAVSMAALNDWVIRQKMRRSAGLRLFCFPYAGAGASVFRNWMSDVDSDIEVYSVQLPGRENRLREPTLQSFEELVPALTGGIMGLLDRPFAFYGHSLGAKIAFETARALRRSYGREPSHLFIGASPAPHLPWPHPHMHVLTEQGLIEEIQKRYGGVPRQVVEDAELRRLLIPALRADVRLMETYRYIPEPPLGCPITVFGGTSDHMVGRLALERWRDQTSNSFRLHMMVGDHFFLREAQRHLLGLIGIELQAWSEGK